MSGVALFCACGSGNCNMMACLPASNRSFALPDYWHHESTRAEFPLKRKYCSRG